ncbi:MAG TPA: DUF418 domain-containing protein [Flavihumibacter sp.]
MLTLTGSWETAGLGKHAQLALAQEQKGLDYWVYLFSRLLLHQKIAAVLLLVFGISLFKTVIESKDKNRFDFLLRRQLWFLILGVVNALIFLYRGDLLFFIGVLGILFFVLARLTVRTQLSLVILFCLIWIGRQYWYYSDDRDLHGKYAAVLAIEKQWPRDTAQRAASDTLTSKQATDKATWEQIAQTKKYDSAAVAGARAAMRSTTYSTNFNHVLNPVKNEQTFWIFREGIWLGGMMILLGMASNQARFFSKRFSSSFKLIWGLFALGTAAGWGYLQMDLSRMVATDYTAYISRFNIPANLFYPLEIGLSAFGWISILAALADKIVFPWRALTAVGSMPLTIYMMQCLATSLFFSGYGFDFYGMYSAGGLLLFGLELNLLLIAFAAVWTHYFNAGPLEYLLTRAITGTTSTLIHETV